MIGRNLKRKIRWALRRRLLQREDRTYNRLFAKRQLFLPTEEAINQRVRERLPSLRPITSGRIKSIALYRNYNWENPSLLQTLRSFGDVRHYDWNVSFSPVPKRFSARYRMEMNTHLLHVLRAWIAEDRPDVIFFYASGESLELTTLAEIQKWHIPMVNVSFNDKENFVGKVRAGMATGARDICRYFDVWWTSTLSALPKLVVEGAAPICMPEAANPELHRPFPDEDFHHDVSFVGACYRVRQHMVDWLKTQGIDVATWGFGWPAGPLAAEEMVRTYSRSRINLGFATVAAHSDIYCLKGRDFEVPMSGGLYLTQHHNELEGVFKIGREIMTWRSYDELLIIIRRLLDNPSEAAAIRRAGRARCMQDHSWRRRFENIFKVIGLMEKQSRKSSVFG